MLPGTEKVNIFRTRGNYFAENQSRLRETGMATASLSQFLRRLTRGMAAETLLDQSDRQLVARALAGPACVCAYLPPPGSSCAGSLARGRAARQWRG